MTRENLITGHVGITAEEALALLKTNKIEKKLKAVDLQLKKLKIDNDNGNDPNDVINGQGYVITDRNELLKKLSGKE